ncbi:NAD(P)/FAD-dependent oxidoreductase [Ruegeria atlantica]|uniref:NAD(P)/FAD-dependent oxidoreductase n=1 Tax=Ruegeria atlantica TaxID=81569 RepID=UPI00148188EC|nr:FAD-binding oxidoreductase [Ruegeria atlantica]
MKIYDSLVVGSGVYGTFLAWELGRKGQNVLVLEEHDRNAINTSNAGTTRLLRFVYDQPKFANLMTDVQHAWHELAERYDQCVALPGVLDIAETGNPFIQESKKAASKLGIAFKSSTQGQIFQDQCRQLELLYHEMGGLVHAPKLMEKVRNESEALGVEFRFQSALCSWQKKVGVGFKVSTPEGAVYCKNICICIGPKVANMISRADIGLRRETFVILHSKSTEVSHEILQLPSVWRISDKAAYLIPDFHGSGLKIGLHGSTTWNSNVAEVGYELTQDERTELKQFLYSVVPAAKGCPLSFGHSTATMTRNGNFFLGEAKNAKNLFFVSACNGHGFKFAPVIAEALCNLMLGGTFKESLRPHLVEDAHAINL